MVDMGLSGSKLAYKVYKGEATVLDGVEYMVDRGVSVVSTIIKVATSKVVSKLGQSIGTSIGTVFGPIGMGIGNLVGKTVGYLAGNVIGSVISKGVEKVSGFFKSKLKSLFGKKEKESVLNWWETIYG